MAFGGNGKGRGQNEGEGHEMGTVRGAGRDGGGRYEGVSNGEAAGG